MVIHLTCSKKKLSVFHDRFFYFSIIQVTKLYN